MQYTGRLHKTEVRAVPMLLKMFERRLRGYRAIGYTRDEAPLGFESIEDDIRVVAEEEEFRFSQGDE